MSAWVSYALRQGQFFKPVLVSRTDEGIECLFCREHLLIVIRVEIAPDHNAFDCYATDLRGGVVGHAGPLVGVGVALFEVKPNKTLHLVRQTVTAPGGNYYFNKVRPGQYVVRIRKIDYPLEVRETETQDIPVITAPRH